MPRNEKTHGACLPALRAFVKNDPLISGFSFEMLAQATLGIIGVFVVLLAVKGWVVTWM